MDQRKKILFVCTGNSCRSQMAEAVAKDVLKDSDVYSCGTKPAESISRITSSVLSERDYTFENLYPKSPASLDTSGFDLVVTLCDDAKQQEALLPEAKRYIHAPFSDPYEATGTEEQKADVYRKSLNEIETWINTTLLNELKEL